MFQPLCPSVSPAEACDVWKNAYFRAYMRFHVHV